MNTNLRIVVGVYARLLQLFPPSFRSEFGEEMSLDFMDAVNEAGQKGSATLWLVLLKEFWDFPFSLLRAHMEEVKMSNIFHFDSLRKILRIAFALGLAYAIEIFAGGILSLTSTRLIHFLRFLHSIGWQGTYKEVLSIQTIISSLILGPLSASLFLLFVFSELRPAKRYLPITMLFFALPPMLSYTRLYSAFPFSDTIFGIANLLIPGLCLGALVVLITREHTKASWLLLAGVLSYFGVTLGSALWLVRILGEHQRSFWGGALAVALHNIFVGVVVGLLLGVISVLSQLKTTESQAA